MFEKIEINGQPEKPKISISDIEKYRIKITDEIPKPDVVLSIGGKIVATRKNIFGITGKAKVGKSFLMTLIQSAVLKKGEFGVLESYLPKGKDEIIVFDTEQSDYHVKLSLERLKKLIGEDKLVNLRIYAFDAVPTSLRFDYVEYIINNSPNAGLVIIDGIADLVKTVNDEIIACDMADSLRRWATINDIAIGYVLHQNPSESTKMRGHLGTVLTNKSETVIQIESSIDNESIKLVSTTQTRNAKPEDWSFEIIDGIPTIMDEFYSPISENKRSNKNLNDFEKYSILQDVFVGHEIYGLSYSIMTETIRSIYVKMYGNIGETKLKQFINYCKEKEWLTQPDGSKKNYFLYPFKN